MVTVNRDWKVFAGCPDSVRRNHTLSGRHQRPGVLRLTLLVVRRAVRLEVRRTALLTGGMVPFLLCSEAGADGDEGLGTEEVLGDHDAARVEDSIPEGDGPRVLDDEKHPGTSWRNVLGDRS